MQPLLATHAASGACPPPCCCWVHSEGVTHILYASKWPARAELRCLCAYAHGWAGNAAPSAPAELSLRMLLAQWSPVTAGTGGQGLQRPGQQSGTQGGCLPSVTRASSTPRYLTLACRVNPLPTALCLYHHSDRSILTVTLHCAMIARQSKLILWPEKCGLPDYTCIAQGRGTAS